MTGVRAVNVVDLVVAQRDGTTLGRWRAQVEIQAGDPDERVERPPVVLARIA